MKKETLTIRFLYGTAAGRMVLKLLTRPVISKAAGIYLNSRISGWMIPLFIKKHGIDMHGYEQADYRSFNDFFTRKRQAEPPDPGPGHFISPCDGYLSVYPVSQTRAYKIKNVEYRLDTLLQDPKLAERFSGGVCLIFRLTPQDYHRYCYICGGMERNPKMIPGKLHCVRPAAYTSRPVFVENSREYSEIQSPVFGTVIQMEIGALLVGRIHNYRREGQAVRGKEKGYFAFGGSTILALVQKGRLEIAPSVMARMRQGLETKVRMGEVIGIPPEKGEKTAYEQRTYTDC